MRAIALCPLTKLFLADWHDRLIEEPELLFDHTPFTFVVPRNVGALGPITYGKMFRVDDMLRGGHSEADQRSVLDWVTGGPGGDAMQETNWTGVVSLDIDYSVDRKLTDMAEMNVAIEGETDERRKEGLRREIASIQKDVGAALKEARTRAAALSQERVMHQIKRTHVYLMKQFQTNKEEGKGLYNPSNTEHLGAYALRKLIQVSKGKREMNEQFQQLTREIGIQ
jgi:hypothetical protein